MGRGQFDAGVNGLKALKKIEFEYIICQERKEAIKSEGKKICIYI